METRQEVSLSAISGGLQSGLLTIAAVLEHMCNNVRILEALL